MNIRFINKIRTSLFSKILLVFLVSFALIIVFSIYSHRLIFKRPPFERIPNIFIGYSELIVNKIPAPIDTAQARIIADSLNVKMRIESGTLNWSSRPDIPEISSLQFEREFRINPITMGGFLKNRRGIAIKISRDNTSFLLLYVSDREAFRYAAFMQTLLLIFISIIIIVGVYFFINWLLRPIRNLHEGVEQIGEGNLDYAIETRRADELGQLADSFNSMSARIREMIHARDQLLLDVSHELRSPLTRMKVALEFMEDSAAKQSLRDDIIETETMVTELLETERLKSQYGGLHKKPVNISEILHEVVEGFRGHAPEITLMDFPDNIILQADPDRLKIVFKNVLSNALKYSAASDKPVQVKLEKKPETVTIIIRDFGEGIPEGELPYIFEPFYRVDKSRTKKTGGYGLGLNLSRKIMEAHGGSIEITSKLKSGTVVYLKFRTKN
ncbi:MAG: HAMP domain-containing sensor histidine kinase [Calditrichia bacterium]